ncbi:hypothetical protein KR032_010517 [Drosophila birchii]|nr:hypothetical protein KR032_010517 [Drosophila birchii]
MEPPSMVERSGDDLVVRSLVSGAPMFRSTLDTGEEPSFGANLLTSLSVPLPSLGTAMLSNPEVESVMDILLPEDGHATITNEEDLPQCKIRRNYSCNQCAFYTQNPRSHLSHLRDVHGERIVINECKLCLYASRHFQKLVRHMKMVHGCSDDNGMPGSSGGAMRAKYNLNREVRRRRLEESIEGPITNGPGANPNLSKIPQNEPTLEQLKMELQREEQKLVNSFQMYKRQQDMQQLQQIVDNHDNIFAMAFELQLQSMPNASPEESIKLDVNNSSSDSEEAPQSPSMDMQAPAPGAQQFQCHKCSYITPIRSRYKKHVKYHTMPLIKCSSCDFHTPYKWNLDRHTKNHGCQGLYKCTVCDFSTDIKQSLTIHELNHHVPTVGHQMAARRKATNKTDQDQEDQQPSSSRKIIVPPITAPDSPIPEPMGISCSHCQQRMPNAVALIKHLQVCAQALKNNQHLLRVAMDGADTEMMDEDLPNAVSDLNYCGVETAPGYGEVTQPFVPEESNDNTPLKKVFKCPHCTFWAATASRFHVHIVGHLNRKPFECSLCSYRSNWRWDITKHIRLKTIRDPSHKTAKVLMNDETGRRNYAKYNKYLTLMKVNVNQAGDVKHMRTGEMIVVPKLDDLEEEIFEPIENALDLSKPKEEESFACQMNTKESAGSSEIPAQMEVLQTTEESMELETTNDKAIDLPLDLTKPQWQDDTADGSSMSNESD